MYSNFYKFAEAENANTWKLGTFAYNDINDVAKIDDYFYGVGNISKIVVSYDGRMWNNVPTTISADNLCSIMVKYGVYEYFIDATNEYKNSGKMVIIVGNNSISKTYDFVNYEDFTPDFVNSNLVCGCFAFNKFFVAGTSGLLASSDGDSWISLDSGITSTINSLRLINNILYGVSSDGKLIISEDGVNWTVRQITGFSGALYDVAIYSGIFFVCGANNSIYISYDGINWEKATSNVSSSAYIQGFCSILDTLYVFGRTGAIGYFDLDDEDFKYLSTTNKTITKVLYDNITGLCVGVGALNFFMDTNQQSTVSKDILMETTSTTALQTILTEAYVVNENSVKVSCSLWIQNGSTKYNLIAENTVLENGQVIKVVNKPMILSKDDKLYFRANNIKCSATALFSYGV